jgi:hypothetical protein
LFARPERTFAFDFRRLGTAMVNLEKQSAAFIDGQCGFYGKAAGFSSWRAHLESGAAS